MKDAVATMGAILPDDAGGRDAVHVAVFSAYSPRTVYPGQSIGRTGATNGVDTEVATEHPEPTEMIAIVDPFLGGAVHPGQRFWAYLLPRTITGLSHKWEHPAFGAEAEKVYAAPASKLASEQWLRSFCESADCPGYEEVMGAAAQIADGRVVGWDGEYMHFNELDAHGEIPPEFWDHVEVVLGRPIKGQRATYFSCAC